MIGSRRVLAVVPARGGSKGLPRKNVLLLGGRPLLAWTIDAARRSRYVDRVVVSTDDEEIAQVARQSGGEVPFMRPPRLASDTASSMEVVEHVLQELPGFDVFVLLQPTSPLRSVDDIDRAIELCAEDGAPVVSLVKSDKSPRWMYSMDESHRLAPVLSGPVPSRRQDAGTIYVLNGAVYVATVPWLVAHRTFLADETLGWVMPPERSIDIDGPIDFALAELLAVRPPTAPHG